MSLIPPYLEWRKAKRSKAALPTEAQAEAEAAELHEISIRSEPTSGRVTGQAGSSKR